MSAAKSQSGFDAKLPHSLRAERRNAVALIFLARAQKRNALDDATVRGLETFFSTLPEGVKAVVLAGEGEHFCAGPPSWTRRLCGSRLAALRRAHLG